MLNLIEIIKTIILGIIEGVTEWLPISSTGHLILVNEIIQLDVSAKFQEMFNVVIQLGAIMAVVLVNFNKLNPFAKSKNRKEFIETISLWKKVII
ncbi:MAG: undecaprenyl-diphosphatase, partial [Streptococcus sp.]|nr:undecaprenyl-diphosphatase [Streptococcus sp.]